MGGALLAIGALLTSIITAGLSQFDAIKTYIREYREKKDPTLANTDGNHILYSMAHCNILTLNNQIISNLPISTHILSFMVGYILYGYSAGTNYSVSTILLIILVVFLLIDTIYNYLQCSGALVLIPLIIGGVCGLGWGAANKSSYIGPNTNQCQLDSTTKKIFGCKMRGV